jgi:transcriptional regulator with XRE-family HTH domain
VSSYTQTDQKTSIAKQEQDTLAQLSEYTDSRSGAELNPQSLSTDMDGLSISRRLSELRNLMEKRQGRRITDEELASRFRVSKSSIGNWKRDMVKTLLPETERRFQELHDEAVGERSDLREEGPSTSAMYPRTEGGNALINGTVNIVTAYLQRCGETLESDELRDLIVQVKRGLAS